MQSTTTMNHMNNRINAASNLISMIEKAESRDDVFGDLDFRAICDSAKDSLMNYIRQVVGNSGEETGGGNGGDSSQNSELTRHNLV